jgi:NADP-dependent 3-hydroxy acid dehydrogenase YdfG
MEVKNKIAVVTGVSKGIGFAVAQTLLQQGAIVFGLGRNNQLTHDNYTFIECDVKNPVSVEQAFATIYKSTQQQIHILINNAGLGYFGKLEDITYEQWDELYQTNVSGIFYCCKQVLPVMKQQEYGHIINISSIAGLEGATKFAVKGLSESLFKEVRDYKIKVTCIYPGSVKTDFFRNHAGVQPHDYMLMPEDIADNIMFVLKTPDNYHTVNVEVRPLQPKGPRKA